MGWIVQEYEGAVHVVPDTEPGHVLELACFCGPRSERVGHGLMVLHTDEADRTLAAR